MRSMLQVRLASRKLVQTPSALLPARRLFSHKEPFVQWTAIPANSSCGALPTAVSKMVTRFVRHHDQGTTICRSTSIRRNKAGTADSVRKTGSKRFVRSTMASTDS